MRTTAPLLILWMIVQGGCSDLFNTKDNTDTDEIFDEGKIDPLKVDGCVQYCHLGGFELLVATRRL